MTAFQEIHVLPDIAMCDYQGKYDYGTDRQTRIDRAQQSDP